MLCGGAFTAEGHKVRFGCGVLRNIFAEVPEKPHTDKDDKPEHRSLVAQEAAEDNHVLVENFKITILHDRYRACFSYLAHEILTRGSTIVVAISAIMAPMANSTEP